MGWFEKTGVVRLAYTSGLRKGLGWFPAWPAGSVVKLGYVGIYDKKRKDFTWETTLEDLGVDIPGHAPREGNDQIFSSAQDTSIAFQAKAGVGTAEFEFHSSDAVVAQMTHQEIMQLDEKDLYTGLVKSVERGEIEWNFDWRVVTVLFSCDAATILVNYGRSGTISLGTRLLIGGGEFNIADPALHISAGIKKGMIWNSLAKQMQNPWFGVHFLQKTDDKVILHKTW